MKSSAFPLPQGDNTVSDVSYH